MKAIFCPICKNLISKNDRIVVMIKDLKCIDNDGNYEVSHDWLAKSILCHNECIKKEFKFFEEEFDDYYIYKVQSLLESIGEKPEIKEIISLLRQMKTYDNNEIVKRWFVNKEVNV